MYVFVICESEAYAEGILGFLNHFIYWKVVILPIKPVCVVHARRFL